MIFKYHLAMVSFLNISGFEREGQVVALIFLALSFFLPGLIQNDSYFVRNPVKLRLDYILKLILFFSFTSDTWKSCDNEQAI